ncbi:MerC domain-containing protein [Persicitalea sp.]|uniref:MerC domain-containing protein n=1 Tax=Persicitalea sp. TaxID=3100273 RepID=UPI0035942878
MKFNPPSSTPHTHGKADYVGVTGSVLCLVHCLITPALALGSSLSVDHHAASTGLDFLFILINGLAVFFATRDHHSPALRLFLWISFALFSVSLLLGHDIAGFRILGYVGSGLLIVGHLYNLAYCRIWLGEGK